MHCPRCNGLMYRMELRDTQIQSRASGMVCLLCGEIVDPVIAGNRIRALQGILQTSVSRTRRRRGRRLVMR
jgi:hypothetical protein